MPVHGWICENCGFSLPDQYQPWTAAVAVCPVCHHTMIKSWQRRPRALFKPFTVDYGKGPVEITSLDQVRRIERESAHEFDAGKSGKMVFRAFSQDDSNYDVNTLESEGYQQTHPRNPKVKGGRHAPRE